MARVGIQIKFYYEDILFVDSIAYLPRGEALKIPELQVEQNQQKTVMPKQVQSRSEQKKSDYDEEEMIDENQNDDNQNDDNQENGEPEQMEGDGMQEENQQEEDIEIDASQNIQYDDEDDEQEDEQIDISQISRSYSNLAHFGKSKTKRQKGQLDNFLELPNKRPRKDAKKSDEATELIRKQQKQRKRKQYIKKLMQAQEKATFEKILNQTGRKFKQRQQKQLKQEQLKERRVFGTLGDVPKIITIENEKNPDAKRAIFLHKTKLFPSQMLRKPEVKMGELCQICQKQTGKYKTPQGQYFCSVACFKILKNCKKTH